MSFYIAPLVHDHRKTKCKKNRVNHYPLFTELSEFLIDPYWQGIFKDLAQNSMPHNFLIRGQHLTIRRGNKPYRFPLVVQGLNEGTGLLALNPRLAYLFPPKERPTLSYLTAANPNLMMSPADSLNPAMQTPCLYSTPRTAILAQNEPATDISILPDPEMAQLAHFYIHAHLQKINSIDGQLLQMFLLNLIKFLREYGTLNSPADLARQQATRTPVAEVTWSNLDKSLRQQLYEKYIDMLLSQYSLNEKERQYAKAQLMLYYLYNQVRPEMVDYREGRIIQILGLDLSRGLPSIAHLLQVKSVKSNKPAKDPLLEKWRTYLLSLA